MGFRAQAANRGQEVERSPAWLIFVGGVLAILLWQGDVEQTEFRTLRPVRGSSGTAPQMGVLL